MFAEAKIIWQTARTRTARDFERDILFIANRLCVAICARRVSAVENRVSLFQGVAEKLVEEADQHTVAPNGSRVRSGRKAQSSVGVIDSQSTKTVDTAREAVSFDGGKKVKGRKRHLLVDSLGLLIVVVVHAAGVSETASAREVLSELTGSWWRMKLIWLDGGYKESLIKWIKGLKRWREVSLEWVMNLEGEKGFRLLPKRWIVERTFGWLSKQRRLSKDYEALCETSEAMVYAGMIRLMVVRLDS